MPARQRGSVVKRGSSWQARWYDETGARKARGGFSSRSEARDWLDGTVKGVSAFRRGDRPTPAQIPLFGALVERFLQQHDVDPATTQKMRWQLAGAIKTFGDTPIDRISPMELAAWRAQLPARSRPDYFRAIKQVLEQAVTWELIERNPCERIRNKRASLDESREILPFADWGKVDAIGAELEPRYSAIPVFAVGTGMRPEEWIALERRDIDWSAGVASVERVYSQGRLKPCKKSDKQRRRVPLRAKVLEALDATPRRIDSPLLFPARDGGHINLRGWRPIHWVPALAAAGVDHRGPYAMRHTFAAWGLAAGVQLYYLSRIMGTSVAQIDATYGHLLPDSEDYLRGLLDSYDEAIAS